MSLMSSGFHYKDRIQMIYARIELRSNTVLHRSLTITSKALADVSMILELK